MHWGAQRTRGFAPQSAAPLCVCVCVCVCVLGEVLNELVEASMLIEQDNGLHIIDNEVAGIYKEPEIVAAERHELIVR